MSCVRATTMVGLTYREYNDHALFALYDNTQIETHFESLESLMNEDVLDAASRYEARTRSANIARGRCRGLDSKSSYHEQRFRGMKAMQCEPSNKASKCEAVGQRNSAQQCEKECSMVRIRDGSVDGA